MIRAIIFDCFGVLVVSRRAALFEDFPTLTTEIHDLELRSDYGYISRVEFNQAVGELIQLDPDEVDKRYWSGSTRNESALAFIRELRSGGAYKTGLLTNVGKDWLEDFLPAVERTELFDAEVISSEVGMLKPQPEIYELVAEQLGCEPSECVMIDDLPPNVEGAIRVGMQGIVFVSTEQLQRDLGELLAKVR